MATKLGSASISKLYLGSNEISKAYLGANEFFSSGDTTTFITTWRTTTSNETITIPTTGGGYNYNITTSDGQTFTSVSGNQTITFASAGDYDVSISGDFPRIYINNSRSQKLKLIDIKQWGNIVWSSFASAFYGCSNLTGSFTDAPNLTNVTSLYLTFTGAINFNGDVSSWNTSNVTNMFGTFYIASSFNKPLNNWDVSNVTIMSGMFRGASTFNQDINNWDVSNVTNMDRLLQQTAFNQNIGIWDITSVSSFLFFLTSTNSLTTANYDAILIGWEATLQAAFPNGSGYTPSISINFGNSEYTGGGAAEASRTSLINNFNWTITDGGIA